MSEPLMRAALSVAFITKPVRRQQLFSLVPRGTFKGDAIYFRLAAYFAKDTEDRSIDEIVEGAGLDPIAVSILTEEEHTYRPLSDYLVRLLGARLTEATNAGQSLVPWATAITRISELARADQTGATIWPDPVDLVQLSQSEPYPQKFIMKDWLPCGYATLFAGHGGIGKSALALVLAVCVALGLPFFGLQVERRRVLYLSCEDREGVLHWRLNRICSYLGIQLADLAGKLDVLDLVGRESILYQPGRNAHPLTDAYRHLAKMIQDHASQVLFVDGISDTYDGNENARAEVKAYINALLALIPPEDGAVVLVGHVSKPAAGQRTTEGYSGSTGWHNSVRARWYLFPEAKREEGGGPERTGDLILELQKSNLGPTDGAMRFNWDVEAGMFVGTVDQGESHFDRNYREREEQAGIMAALIAATGPVPAATSGQRTAYHVLSVQDEFPQSLLGGNTERKRFWKHVERLRAMGEITEDYITRADRHKVRVLTPKSLDSSACGHAGNVEYQIAPHNGRTPLCGHAGNAAGGYKGGPAPAQCPETPKEEQLTWN
ncbi:AAA family ATPase [Geomonas agri]|uniref:AAA family ATPase n=1 Tax=Geomonas agri TaxID=2873702 RepID=UPI001CD5B90E|nr:AAA family ATPase [Geomonas agri]